MVSNIRVYNALEFVKELMSADLIGFSEEGIDIAGKLLSTVRKFVSILLANDFLDAMLFAMSRIKKEKIKPYRIFEICDINDINKRELMEDKDSLVWFLMIFFILRRVFSRYDLRFRAFEDFVYFFTRDSGRMSSQYKYVIVAYLYSLAKFLESMVGGEE